ncbi:helix-turn-helix domain-containing protein [Streptomyces sp. NBC_01485]|uniref:helix-turn-helix domain-containing protein n=1 Tax=Streptomyces sp. NBC_01485 TaxID=2903884 RepID=UPI002E33BF70|nr:helix-turn-helix transcriptional regulator [Streptomyces sp. NBC_01485]
MPRDTPDWIIERRRDLGERIADLRAAAHYDQISFCEATGLSRRHLQRIESGEADPRYGDLLRIAAVLNQELSVFGVTGTPPTR